MPAEIDEIQRRNTQAEIEREALKRESDPASKERLKKRDAELAGMNDDLILSEQAMSFIVQKGYDLIYGARPLKRVIQQYIESPLSMDILKGNILDGNRVNAEVDGDQIVFKTG